VEQVVASREQPAAAQVSGSSALLVNVINSRYSCRGFRGDVIAREDIEQILQLAQRAPSWCNAQGWKVHLTSGAGTARFSEALLGAAVSLEENPDFETPREYTGVRLDRRRAAGFALYNAVGIERQDRDGRVRQALANYEFFGAPHVALLTVHEELGPYALVDVGSYIASFCYAAQAFGVATVVQAAIGLYATTVRKALDIPEEERIVCAISFGRPEDEHPANGFRTDRADVEQVVRWVDR
jgi:nitroreductase